MIEWDADVASMSGNAGPLSRLAELMHTGEAIAFLGAGASAPLYPTWNELLAAMIERAREHGASEDQLRAWRRRRDRPLDVAARIQQEMGTGHFASVIREIFGPRSADEGGPYTSTHELVTRCRFRGIVTTNYDPGILAARAHSRPDVATSYLSCNQPAIRLWEQTGHDFFPQDRLPVLFAHGHFLDGEDVVLTRASYRRAYSGPLRQVMVHLLRHRRLVWIGWGFKDPWVEAFEEQVSADLADLIEPPHIAILGWEKADGDPRELRAEWAEVHRAELVLYQLGPPGPNHHDGLSHILQSVARSAAPDAVGVPTRYYNVVSSPTNKTWPQKWVHATTEDEGYLDRPRLFDTLDRYTTEPGVSLVGVTGIGGLGKTALIAQWAKHRSAPSVRERYRGLFFWSWYASENTAAFVAALVEWINETFGSPLPTRGHTGQFETIQALAPLIASIPVLIVLDGLEVVQEDSKGTQGRFLDPRLAELVRAFGRKPQMATILMTSRFTFVDLRRYLGISARCMQLEVLSPDEGVRLLGQLGVAGTGDEHRRVVKAFDGHPLALRIVAASVTGPTATLSMVEGLTSRTNHNEPLGLRMGRLLQFYEKHLDSAARRLLALVALFRSPVAEATLVGLATSGSHLTERGGAWRSDELSEQLRRLESQGLVTRAARDGGPSWSAHPIVREHFRQLLSESPTARMAAAQLIRSPIGASPTNDVSDILNAIEILIASGDMSGADQLSDERLDRGGWFGKIGDAEAGLRCSYQFVSSRRRRLLLRKAAGREALAWHLGYTALFAGDTGEVSLFDSYFPMALAEFSRLSDRGNVGILLRNMSEFHLRSGRLEEARKIAQHALRLAQRQRRREPIEVRYALARVAEALSVAGHAVRADELLQEASKFDRPGWNDPNLATHVNIYISHALRTHRVSAAREMASEWVDILHNEAHFAGVAFCHFVLAECLLAEGDPSAALEELSRSKAALHVPSPDAAASLSLQLSKAYLYLGRLDDALDAVEESISIASARGWVVKQVDGLVARGRVYLAMARADDSFSFGPANDDSGMHLAREIGYAWGELDARVHLTEVRKASGLLDGVEGAQEAESLGRLLLDPLVGCPAPSLRPR